MPPEPSATTDMPQIVPDPVAVPTPDPNASPAPPSGAADVSVQPPAVPAPEPPPRPREPVAPRISELVGQRARLEQLVQQQSAMITQVVESNKALMDRLNTTQSAPNTPQNPSPEFNDPRPDRDSFPDPVAFETALIDWSARRTATQTAAEVRRQQEEFDRQRADAAEALRRQQEDAAAQERQQTEARRIEDQWEQRQSAARQQHEDYDEIARRDNLPVSHAMAAAIVRYEQGPEILYWLGKNPAEAARISAIMAPNQFFPPGTPAAGLPVPDITAQAFEIGMIAARLQAPNGSDAIPPVPPTSTPSANALAQPAPVPTLPSPPSPPPPPTPITGGSAAANARDIYTIGNQEGNMNEYAAARQPQIDAERRARRGLH